MRAWVVSPRTRAATTASRVSTMPPPPEVMILFPLKERQLTSPSTAHGASLVPGAQGLRGVLHHGQGVAACHLEDGVDVHGMAVEVHGQHGAHDTARRAVDDPPLLDRALAREEVGQLVRVEPP